MEKPHCSPPGSSLWKGRQGILPALGCGSAAPMVLTICGPMGHSVGSVPRFLGDQATRYALCPEDGGGSDRGLGWGLPSGLG